MARKCGNDLGMDPTTWDTAENQGSSSLLLPYSLLCWLSLPKLVFSWLQGGGRSSWHHSLFQGRNNNVVSVTLCLLFSQKLWTSYTPVSHGSSLLKYRFRYSSSTMEPETLHFDWVQRASSASGSWILSSSGSSQRFSFILWPELTHKVTSSWEAGRPLPFSALLGESSKKEVEWKSGLATHAQCTGTGGRKVGLGRVQSVLLYPVLPACSDTSQPTLHGAWSRNPT